MGAQIPKAPQETQGTKIGGNAFELSRQLETLTGRPAAGFRTQATAQWKPAVTAFRNNPSNTGRRAPTVEDFLGQMLQQEQAVQRSAVRAVQQAPVGSFPAIAQQAAAAVTPLPTVTGGAPAAAEPGAGGPPARSAAEVQKAAEDERRRVGRQRGRGSTVLTPFDIPIPTGSIAKTVLGGRI